MTQIATQTPNIFNRHADIVLEPSAGERVVQRYQPGTFSETPGGFTPVTFQTKGLNTAEVLAGSERGSSISFGIQNAPTTREDVEAILTPAVTTAGAITTFTLHIDFYDDLSKTTGKRYTYTGCYCDTQPSLSDAGGNSNDTLSCQVMSRDGRPAVSDLTAG